MTGKNYAKPHGDIRTYSSYRRKQRKPQSTRKVEGDEYVPKSEPMDSTNNNSPTGDEPIGEITTPISCLCFILSTYLFIDRVGV